MAASVTVACKLPMGLHLRLHAPHKIKERTPDGGQREVEIARAVGSHVVINGTSAPFGQARKDADGNFVQMAGGYALTFGVDKDFWDRWLLQNSELHPVKTGLIFAHEKQVETEAKSKDRASVLTGLEPLVPTITDGGGRVLQIDPRTPVRNVSQGDRKAA